MKKHILILIITSSIIAKADEGIWMPQLIDALNFKDMKKKWL